MRARLGKIVSRAKMMPVMRGSTIIVRWNEFDSSATEDRLSSQKIGEATARSKTIKGFVHFVSPSTTGYRVHSEIETGDAILELPADVKLDGLGEVTFDIGGVLYVQKNIGSDLTKSFDGQIQDQRLFRTLVVTRKA